MSARDDVLREFYDEYEMEFMVEHQPDGPCEMAGEILRLRAENVRLRDDVAMAVETIDVLIAQRDAAMRQERAP